MVKLNEQQENAVRHIDSPLLVVAGAGSGKTGVITQKIAYLIQQKSFDARSIYALTFTNKAAKEMKTRSRKLLGEKSKGLNVSTFHRLGLEFIRKEYAHCGIRANFTIFDARDSHSLLKEITKSEDNAVINNIKTIISQYKNQGLAVEQAKQLATDEMTSTAAIAYEKYQQRLKLYNAVDFDDLLRIPTQLLKQDAEIRYHWQNKIRYLLIDEYQDTNDCQYDLIQLLTGKRQAFTAVGDDDQSIYAWRGAQPENIKRLHEDYPQLVTILLEQNFRCHQAILNAANDLIGHNPHIVSKRLWSTLTKGEGICVLKAKNEELEAEKVIHDIHTKQVIGHHKLSEFAILYRSNYQSRVLELKLRELNIPYKISGGTSFYEHSEIRDLMAYLRLINNPDDDAAFLRICNIPKREIGLTTLNKLANYAAYRRQSLLKSANEIGFSKEVTAKAYAQLNEFTQWISLMQREADNDEIPALVNRIIDDIDYTQHLHQLHKETRKVQTRLERIGQLKAWLSRLAEDQRYQRLDKLMQHLLLLDIMDKQDNQQEAVQLMTLHSAKGLEFSHVYVVGVEEELLPHVNSSELQSGIEEERRLLYVGMTRAKQSLTLTYCRQRKRGGQSKACQPSRFFDELPEKGIAWYDGKYQADKEEEKERVAAMFDSLRDILKQ